MTCAAAGSYVACGSDNADERTASSDSGIDSADGGSGARLSDGGGGEANSSGSAGSGGRPSTGGQGGDPGLDGGPRDASSNPADGSDSDGAASCSTLTIRNYSSWCSVSVNESAFSMAAEQSVCVQGTAHLAATATSGFILGDAPWHHTDGDSGNGEQGTLSGSGPAEQSAATKTLTSDACVWICCPFPDGSGCPETDQCL
jgi:hypothetical protein